MLKQNFSRSRIYPAEQTFPLTDDTLMSLMSAVVNNQSDSMYRKWFFINSLSFCSCCSIRLLVANGITGTHFPIYIYIFIESPLFSFTIFHYLNILKCLAKIILHIRCLLKSSSLSCILHAFLIMCSSFSGRAARAKSAGS